MSQSNARPAKLVEQFLPLIQQYDGHGNVLDLACGSGRNGLFLTSHNISVVFADNNAAVLEDIARSPAFDRELAELWRVDFEEQNSRALAHKKFDVILVFNYLHRALMGDIKECLNEGGLLLYETFTVQQASIGRPSNPDFLLRTQELKGWFKDWEILHYFEGVDHNPQRFFANLAARKPIVT